MPRPPHFTPEPFQPALPVDRLISGAARPGGVEEVPVDVLFVGGGPAGLAGAIELARIARSEPGGPLANLQIAVLEKAASLGEHTLSGAVINPVSLRALFPGVTDQEFPFRGRVGEEKVYFLGRRRSVRIPTPPPMRNHGNFVASLCEVVRWMGARAEELGVNILTGYPAASLLMDGSRVTGVRTTPAGLARDGSEGPQYQPAADVTARVSVLAEGTRGSLAQAYMASQKIGSPNPQIFALGVKELWRVKNPLRTLVHTMGWPLPPSAFGGAFMYPMGDDLVSLGIVVGLDYPDHALDAHELLQRLKTHPLLLPHFRGGELLEWGAKTIPEGGMHSLPDRLHGDGVLIVGDAAGLVNVAALKGIHYAMHSGVLAARAVAGALRAGDVSGAGLASYDASLRSSFVHSDLHRTRSMRLGFTRGLVPGIATAALSTITGGRMPSGRIGVHADARRPRRVSRVSSFIPDNTLTFSKLDANFKSGNQTRDDVPLHVLNERQVPAHVAEFYAAMCPAGVYEARDGKLVINAPNCIDCKATDVLGPRWTPREGGSGPRYKLM